MEREPTNKEFQTFVKGMNDGYLIAKFMTPEVAEQIAKTKIYSPWYEGFRCGKSEYDLEKEQHNYRPKWLGNRFNKSDPELKEPDKKSKFLPDKDEDKDR